MSDTTGPVDFTIFNLPPDSQGRTLVNFNIAFIVISTILLCTRLYVRGFMVKVLGLDDLLAAIAYVCAVLYMHIPDTMLKIDRESLHQCRSSKSWQWV